MDSEAYDLWFSKAAQTPEVFTLPTIAPQGENGVAHYNYFDPKRLLSFQWNGRYEQHVTVSMEYGEPVKWTFAFTDIFRTYARLAEGPIVKDMLSGPLHFQQVCDHWIQMMEESWNDAPCQTDASWQMLIQGQDVEEVRERTELRLCYDDWSGRYFMGSKAFIETAVLQINLVLAEVGSVPLNDFYDYVGLPPLEMGLMNGWSDTKVDVRFGENVAPDGQECLGFWFSVKPKPDFDRL